MIRVAKLLPEQVMKYWNHIKYAIEETIPPHITSNSQSMSRIQEHLFGGVLQCWTPVEIGENPRILGFIVTRILYDDIACTSNLLLFSVYGLEDWSFGVWTKGFQILKKYAKSRGCQNIVGYTNSEVLIKIAERFGGSGEYTFLKVPI